MQNFTDIGQSAANLWPKKRFSVWQPSAIISFKNVDIMITQLLPSSKSAVAYQISSKSLKYGDLTTFKMAAVRHIDFRSPR